MILCWLLLVPFIAGLLCWQLELRRAPSNWPRWAALIGMLIILALCLWLWITGDFSLQGVIGKAPLWEREFQVPWIPRFGISFHLAIDGLSLIMTTLASILGVLAVLCSWREVTSRVGFFHFNLAWIIVGVVGVFLSVDMFLFFFFWEMMLVPMYFLIGLWGHQGASERARTSTALKFFIYTQASSLLMLSSILGLVFVHSAQTGIFSFDYNVLRQTPVHGVAAYLLMLGFFVTFAFKLPMVPLHGWLPDTHVQAPTAGSVDLAGILVKTAPYGLLRFALPLFPHASAEFAPIAMAFGLVNIYYGAVSAFGQTDMKRLVAYSGISHMGFILIGIYAGTLLALQGVVAQMLAHAFSSSALFIITGQIYERIQTRDMTKMGGLFGRMGALGGFALFFVMASLGLPGTANFIGEFLILFGTFPTFPWVASIACVGLVLAAIYALILMHRPFWGTPQSESSLGSLTVREYGMLLALLLLSLLVGLYPQLILNISHISMAEVARWFAAAPLSSP